MDDHPVEPTRVKCLNAGEPRDGDYVLYWMQNAQRAEDNPALEVAVALANDHGMRLLVAFGLTASYPDANARHYAFMLEGLADVAERLSARNIKFVVQLGSPEEIAIRLGGRATAVVCDRGYLRHQIAWRRSLVRALACPIYQVEGELVVPVEAPSDKREYAARTLRPKVGRLRDEYIQPLETVRLDKHSLQLSIEGEDIDGPRKRARLLERLGVDDSVAPVDGMPGGTTAAKARFKAFMEQDLSSYEALRNQPADDASSHMSPYLHFGQVSPVWLAEQLQHSRRSRSDRDAYLEELLVRRELAHNFVFHTPDYDSLQAMPDWALRTLEQHEGDARPQTYTRAQLEDARTDDPYWNAAMLEMRYTGFMPNHMRMYWGKRILGYCNTVAHAYRVCLDLNNKYFLDGRDANSFANVGWLFGLHDRPWSEREVFGKVRTMTRGGLERKANPDAYVERVQARLRELGVERDPCEGTA